jgi:2-methylcitrate dehydratase PrpD
MAKPTLAERLAAFATSSTFERLPEEVVASVKMRVLDIIGLCAAATPLATSQAAMAWTRAEGGHPQAQAIGMSEMVTARQAAFVNGVLAHSLDYDDTHLPSVLHPSASVVPASLAVAQASNADGKALVAAIAAGLEVCVRVGMAGFDAGTRNSTFFDHGQHATSICGAIGSAVSAGLLLGLDADHVTHAIGVAASMASGVIEANRTGGTVKRLHCGWAAQAGVSAAQLASHGFTGPPTILEGRFGFFRAWLHGQYDPAAITEGLGTDWSVPSIFFKPYPANHFTHSALDAAIALRARGIRASKVESLTLGVAEPTVRTIGEPIEVKRAPETGYMAQFSGPYMVAAGLLGGSGLGVGLDDFTDELAREPARRALMAKVSVVADERCTQIFPYQFPAVLTVRTVHGSELTEEILVNRGGPGRPLTYDELATKFTDNAARVLSAQIVDQVRQTVAHLEDLPITDQMLAPLAQEPVDPI